MARTFIFREEWLESLNELPEEQKSRVIAALVEFAFMSPEDREDYLPLEEPAERIAFRFISRSIVRDQESYAGKVENGRRGGAPKGNANARKTVESSMKTTENNQKTTSVDFENNQKTTKNNLIQSQSQIQSCYSSFDGFADVFDTGSTEEQEQELIVSEYLFLTRNDAEAQRDARELISYNAVPGRTPIREQTDEQRKACMDRWRIKGGRMTPAQLEAWNYIYLSLVALKAPLAVRMAALDDGLKLVPKERVLNLSCRKILYMALELFIDDLRDDIRRLTGSYGTNTLRYRLTDAATPEEIAGTTDTVAGLKQLRKNENQ